MPDLSMPDFSMPGFWSWFVIILTIIQVVAAIWLINWSGKGIPEGETTGHKWDTLEELNNPLPRWWLWCFYLTIIFTVAYLILYPGLGNFKGTLNWTMASRYDAEVAAGEAVYGEVFRALAAKPIPELVNDPAARSAGRNLFVNNCATCHGSDGRGAISYPNLTDSEWLYGGDPASIVTTLRNGRLGVMPPFQAVLGEDGVEAMTEYMLELAGRSENAELAAQAKQPYLTFCSACHGPTGLGLAPLGAPNLTDDVWLHGGSRRAIRDVIAVGRQNQMPAQAPLLSEERIHVLAAYVLSLAEGGAGAQP